MPISPYVFVCWDLYEFCKSKLSPPQLESSQLRRSKKTSESAQICRMSLCKHAHSVRWIVCLGSRRPWRCSLITMLRFWCHSRNGNAGLILIDILFCPHQLDWSSEQEEVTLSHQKTGRLQECRNTNSLCSSVAHLCVLIAFRQQWRFLWGKYIQLWVHKQAVLSGSVHFGYPFLFSLT